MKLLFTFTSLLLAFFTQAQNIGAGTTTPEMKLHVSSPADTALLLLDNNTSLAANSSVGMYFKNGNWLTGAIKTTGISNSTARLGLYSYASQNRSLLLERMSIADNGNIGINKIDPGQTLDIAGTFNAFNASMNNYTATIANVSSGRGALKLSSGNATGLFTGNSTLLVENDTVTGSAIRAISKWNAISAESVSGSVSTLSVRNSAATNPIAATFTGNVIIDSTTVPNSGVLIVKKGFQYLDGNNARDGKILVSDNNGLASWQDKSASFLPQGSTGSTIRYNGSSWITNANLYNDGSRIGIGTTTPGYTLDINGRTRIRNNGLSAGLWFNKSDNTEAAFVGMANDTVTGFWGNGTVGAWRIGVDVKNARLGIGITDPAVPLSFDNNVGEKISLWGNGASNHYGIGIQTSLMQFYTSTQSADFAFGNGSSNDFSEKMRIKGNGNVGIGTSTPGAKLEVNGKLKITDGTQAANSVLTSDANGLASWKIAPGKALNTILAADLTVNSGTAVTANYVDNIAYCFNDFGSFNNAANSFTIPAGEGGTYLIHVQVSWLAVNSYTGSKQVGITIRKNSTTAAQFTENIPFDMLAYKHQQITQIIKLSAGEVVSIYLSQFSGVPQAVNGGTGGAGDSYMNITRIN